MIDIYKEAGRYDLSSLIKLQDKHHENIMIFESAINNERAASQQEEAALYALEKKINTKIDDTEREWILSDIPKLKSTMDKRQQTISLLKVAIIEEQTTMDREEQMIHYLEKQNDSKK